MIDEAINELEAGNVRFARLFTICVTICTAFFGEPRKSGSSHHVFKTPWPGDPRINLQRDGAQAKRYQVRQALEALQKLKVKHQADAQSIAPPAREKPR